MAIYEILEEIMSERHLCVADIARMCNLSDSTVRGIVRRQQDSIALEVAFKLSDGLGVSLEKLNGMPEKESPRTEESVRREELAQELMGLTEKLSDEQRDLFLALLRLTAARNQGLPVVDLVVAGEEALKSQRRNQT